MKKLFISLTLIILGVGASAQESAYEPYIPNKKEIIFTQEMYKIDSIDPTAFNNLQGGIYPGLRGTNQLIIYTSNFGTQTGTNEYGTEAIVEGNTVSALSGANSFIPSNGFVISGHGNAKKWINKNVILGSKIYIDRQNKAITAYVTSDSFLYGAGEKIQEAQEIMDYYQNNSLNYDRKKTETYIKIAKSYLKQAKNSPRFVQKYSSQAIEAANTAIATAVPYKENELKGVWLRPSELDEQAIIKTLDRLKKSGVNSIFLETFFHGKTIYPSEVMASYGFLKQNEKFIGFDPLRFWIDEAHKRGIKVHIWFESFYIGNDLPSENEQSIVSIKPDWANTNKKNCENKTPTSSLSEHNGYFIDPANPEVIDFLCKLLNEIITDYNPDGINLDYIRYPQSISQRYAGYELSNWGYTEYARNNFKELYGTDPVEISQNTELWLLWNKYRQDKITDFVKRAGELCRDKNTIVTAVIFPQISIAKETKQQDWRSWSVKNYVDGFTPLFLTCDSKVVNSMMSEINRNKAEYTDLYAGLFVTFMGGSQEDLVRQIHETRKLNTAGVIIFDYAHFDDKYIESLKKSIFNECCQKEKTHRKFKWKS